LGWNVDDTEVRIAEGTVAFVWSWKWKSNEGTVSIDAGIVGASIIIIANHWSENTSSCSIARINSAWILIIANNWRENASSCSIAGIIRALIIVVANDRSVGANSVNWVASACDAFVYIGANETVASWITICNIGENATSSCVTSVICTSIVIIAVEGYKLTSRLRITRIVSASIMIIASNQIIYTVSTIWITCSSMASIDWCTANLCGIDAVT